MDFKPRVFLVCVLLAVFLTACDQQKLMEKFVPQPHEDIARQYIEDLRRGDVNTVWKNLDPALQTSQMTFALKQVGSSLYPGETPKSVKIVLSQTNSVSNGSSSFTQYAFQYEYEFRNGWRLAEIVLRNANDATRVVGLHSYMLSKSLEEANAFNFENKSPLQFFPACRCGRLFCVFYRDHNR